MASGGDAPSCVVVSVVKSWSVRPVAMRARDYATQMKNV
jgi:hypothetical protein